MSDLFNEEIISQATHTKWAGKTVHFARETDSTNLWGKRAWREEGAGHGELFVAEYQSAGRGRFTRRWSAPPDSAITMSILICPEFSPQKAPMLTDEKVTYRSSDKKIATVTSKGVVKGIRKGTATITVQSGSKKLTCKVTVK